MMRDHEQLVAVVQAICRRIPKDVVLWTAEGPTDLAVRWLKRSPLSAGERVLFQVAWAVWNGTSSKLALGGVFHRMDGAQQTFVGSLLIALGGGAHGVDLWLEAEAGGDVARCRKCGCTEDQACPGGCSWVEDPEDLGDLCSACAPGKEVAHG